MIEDLNNCKERFKLTSEINEGFSHFWIFIIPIDLSYLNKLSDLPEDETSLKEKNFIISDNIDENSLTKDCISIIYKNGLISSDKDSLFQIQNNRNENLCDEIKPKKLLKPNNLLLPLNDKKVEDIPFKGFLKDKYVKENELLFNKEEIGKEKKEISNNLDDNYSLINKNEVISKSQIQNYNINIYNPYINCVNICCPPSSFSPFSSIDSNNDNNNKLIFKENNLLYDKEIVKGKLPLDCFYDNSKNINVNNIVSDFSFDNRNNNNVNFIINNRYNQLGDNFPVNYSQNELTQNININNNNKIEEIINNIKNKNENNIQNSNIKNVNDAQKAKKTKKKKKKKIDDEYTIEMFGRRGWICEGCNNFNYESRKNCNRCKIQKKPLKKSILMDNKGNKTMDNFINANHKDDWNCYNCGNVNYAFRLNCNRCQMERENSVKAYNEQEK